MRTQFNGKYGIDFFFKNEKEEKERDPLLKPFKMPTERKEDFFRWSRIKSENKVNFAPTWKQILGYVMPCLVYPGKPLSIWYYYIDVNPVVLEKYAEEKGIETFKILKDFQTGSTKSKVTNTALSETDEQNLIIMLIDDVLDLKKYKELGIIRDHFPLHKYKERNFVARFWAERKFSCLLSPINPFRLNNIQDISPIV